MYIPIKNKIKELALHNPNEEVCGILHHTFDKASIFPCENIAQDKTTDFEIDPQKYLECCQLGKPYGIYHSHPKGKAAFSEHDIESANEVLLPYHLYSIEDDKFLEYIPKGYELPVEGLNFVWGAFDCYELLRIYFRQNFNIYMNDYDRDETFESTDSNIIMENFEKEGFHNANSTTLLKKYDVLVFHSKRAYPQHFGIFLGNSRMLHHPLGGLSRIETITSNWQKRLQFVFRSNKPL